jgi:hypothetical protein
VAQLVEHHLAKVGVAGSNPVVRSRSEALSAPTSVLMGHSLGHTRLLPREPLEVVRPGEVVTHGLQQHLFLVERNGHGPGHPLPLLIERYGEEIAHTERPRGGSKP